jgi:type VI secretion system protein VasD
VKSIVQAFSLIVIILVSGCSSTREILNLNTSAVLNISASNEVNPDQDNRPSPIIVRVYQLTDSRQFSREEFISLYQNAEQNLGKDLIDTTLLKEFIPGENRKETLKLSADVHYIGILAEYSQYQKADTMLVLPVTPHKQNSLYITLNEFAVEAER